MQGNVRSVGCKSQLPSSHAAATLSSELYTVSAVRDPKESAAGLNCPECRKPNRPGQKLCAICGASLVADAAPEVETDLPAPLGDSSAHASSDARIARSVPPIGPATPPARPESTPRPPTSPARSDPPAAREESARPPTPSPSAPVPSVSTEDPSPPPPRPTAAPVPPVARERFPTPPSAAASSPPSTAPPTPLSTEPPAPMADPQPGGDPGPIAVDRPALPDEDAVDEPLPTTAHGAATSGASPPPRRVGRPWYHEQWVWPAAIGVFLVLTVIIYWVGKLLTAHVEHDAIVLPSPRPRSGSTRKATPPDPPAPRPVAPAVERPPVARRERVAPPVETRPAPIAPPSETRGVAPVVPPVEEGRALPAPPAPETRRGAPVVPAVEEGAALPVPPPSEPRRAAPVVPAVEERAAVPAPPIETRRDAPAPVGSRAPESVPAPIRGQPPALPVVSPGAPIKAPDAPPVAPDTEPRALEEASSEVSAARPAPSSGDRNAQYRAAIRRHNARVDEYNAIAAEMHREGAWGDSESFPELHQRLEQARLGVERARARAEKLRGQLDAARSRRRGGT